MSRRAEQETGVLHRYKSWLDGFTPIDAKDPDAATNLDKDELCAKHATHMMVRAAIHHSD